MHFVSTNYAKMHIKFFTNVCCSQVFVHLYSSSYLNLFQIMKSFSPAVISFSPTSMSFSEKGVVAYLVFFQKWRLLFLVTRLRGWYRSASLRLGTWTSRPVSPTCFTKFLVAAANMTVVHRSLSISLLCMFIHSSLNLTRYWLWQHHYLFKAKWDCGGAAWVCPTTS